ncbi:hypothetical protein N0V84_012176 [Fusarium piperis]|uniref:Uncharacterized protein n=1 Tax=Fusarium piperis TaxID=1435070 RepID=A0A9W8T953_9HYPO|nr:hypothetical protein N0V84_012176 [Fusarium piperis]
MEYRGRGRRGGRGGGRGGGYRGGYRGDRGGGYRDGRYHPYAPPSQGRGGYGPGFGGRGRGWGWDQAQGYDHEGYEYSQEGYEYDYSQEGYYDGYSQEGYRYSQEGYGRGGYGGRRRYGHGPGSVAENNFDASTREGQQGRLGNATSEESILSAYRQHVEATGNPSVDYLFLEAMGGRQSASLREREGVPVDIAQLALEPPGWRVSANGGSAPDVASNAVPAQRREQAQGHRQQR